MLWKTLKHRQRVAAALRSLSKAGFWLTTLSWLLVSSFVHAMDEEHDSNRFMVQIHAHTPDELNGILKRAQLWADKFETYPEEPIAIVLHGAEANVFVKSNYKMYKPLVDLAAKLDAFNVVDVRICERWMGNNNVQKGELPPFVETVPYGPAEQGRLIKAGYQEF